MRHLRARSRIKHLTQRSAAASTAWIQCAAGSPLGAEPSAIRRSVTIAALDDPDVASGSNEA